MKFRHNIKSVMKAILSLMYLFKESRFVTLVGTRRRGDILGLLYLFIESQCSDACVWVITIGSLFRSGCNGTTHDKSQFKTVYIECGCSLDLVVVETPTIDPSSGLYGVLMITFT